MRLGFIGCGNMGGAMVSGILKKQLLASEDMIASALHEESRKALREKFGITVTSDNSEVAAFSDILILAVKPQFYAEVIHEIREIVQPDTLVVSIAPGKTHQWLEEQFGRPVKTVRCMPNTPAMIGAGITGVAPGEQVTEKETAQLLRLLSALGETEIVPERLMDVVGSVSGCSPAYVFMFIEAMADAAVADGMPRAQAYHFAAQAVLGSAEMVLKTGRHPGELKDMVCSPGGTTIEGLSVLEEKGMAKRRHRRAPGLHQKKQRNLIRRNFSKWKEKSHGKNIPRKRWTKYLHLQKITVSS